MYPRRVLCTREECWDFVANSRSRGAHYFTFATLRRVEDGVASYREEEYGQASIDGVLLIHFLFNRAGEGEREPVEGEQAPPRRLAGLFHPAVPPAALCSSVLSAGWVSRRFDHCSER
jgi:hypothetical protein